MKKVFVVFLLLAVIGGGLGTYGYFYINAAKQINIEIDGVSISNLNIGGSILNPTVSFDMVLQGNISNPTSITVSVDNAEFDVSIESVPLGYGSTGKFDADRDGDDITINFHADNVGVDAALQFIDLMGGNNKTLNIHITKVTVWGISVKVDITTTHEISKDDIIA